MRFDFALSASNDSSVWAAKAASSTFRFASSLRRNERLSKLVEPTETQAPSTTMALQ